METGVHRIAAALGAALFALVGSGALGAAAPGSAAFATHNALGLAAAVLLVVGVTGLGRALGQASSARSRLLRWGVAATAVGFACAAAMHAVAIGSVALAGGIGAAAAIAGVPLVIASHLLYLGTSLVGVALLRHRLAPTAIGVLLAASLPVVLLGVPLGMALGHSGVGGVVAWLATEGQAGAAWLALAVARTGSRATADSG